MSARKSTKINKRQQIAAYFIGQGSRPSKVAKQLQVSRETISRWQNDQAFMKQAQKSPKELLANLLSDKLALVNRCHGIVSEVLSSADISNIARVGVAVRYLVLTGTHSNVYGSVENDWIYYHQLMKRALRPSRTSWKDKTEHQMLDHYHWINNTG